MINKYDNLVYKIISGKYKGFFPNELKPDEYGLVMKGGNLRTKTIIEGYSKGCFPWAGKSPVPWYSPHPRPIIIPHQLHVSKRFKRVIRKNDYEIKFDTKFKQVVTACAEIKRKHESGTWINENIIKAYTRLYRQKIAHSVEVYVDKKLVGGLYGLTLGKVFFGESMFSYQKDASKLALYYLAQFMLDNRMQFIDCQVYNPHLMSMGALLITRENYLDLLNNSLRYKSLHKKWEYNPNEI